MISEFLFPSRQRSSERSWGISLRIPFTFEGGLQGEVEKAEATFLNYVVS